MLFLGDNVIFVRRFPHTVLGVGGYSAVSVNRDSQGFIAVRLEIRSEDGRIIVLMADNGFVINQNNYLQMERPNKSTLAVMDQTGKQVIFARYLNPHVLVLEGEVSVPGHGNIPLQLTNFHRSCIGVAGDGVDIHLEPDSK